MALSASYSDSTSASSFQQSEFDLCRRVLHLDRRTSDLNGNGTGTINVPNGTGEAYLIPLGWNSFVNSRQFERERLGLAYNFNAQLSDTIELVADVFYNDMDEGQHGQQLFRERQLRRPPEFSLPTRMPPATRRSSIPSIPVGWSRAGRSSPQVVTDFTGYTNGLRGGVQSTLRDTNALNTNLELRFGHGEKFSGSVRWVHADADRTQRALTVAQQTDTNMVPRTPGGTPVNVSPNSIPTTSTYLTSGTLGSDQLSYVIGDQLRTLAQNPNAWRLHSNWLERELTESKMDILRADGKFEVAVVPLRSAGCAAS